MHWDDPEGWYGEGGGFRMGNTCIPVADWCWYMAKPIQYCKVKNKKKNCEVIYLGIGEGNGTPLQYFCLENPMEEEPGRLQSMGSLRVGHDWATWLSLFTFMHWRRRWQPTPVFLPGESQGRGSLMGCRLWGRTESGHDWSDLAAAAAAYLGIIIQLMLNFFASFFNWFYSGASESIKTSIDWGIFKFIYLSNIFPYNMRDFVRTWI